MLVAVQIDRTNGKSIMDVLIEGKLDFKLFCHGSLTEICELVGHKCSTCKEKIKSDGSNEAEDCFIIYALKDKSATLEMLSLLVTSGLTTVQAVTDVEEFLKLRGVVCSNCSNKVDDQAPVQQAQNKTVVPQVMPPVKNEASSSGLNLKAGIINEAIEAKFSKSNIRGRPKNILRETDPVAPVNTQLAKPQPMTSNEKKDSSGNISSNEASSSKVLVSNLGAQDSQKQSNIHGGVDKDNVQDTSKSVASLLQSSPRGPPKKVLSLTSPMTPLSISSVKKEDTTNENISAEAPGSSSMTKPRGRPRKILRLSDQDDENDGETSAKRPKEDSVSKTPDQISSVEVVQQTSSGRVVHSTLKGRDTPDYGLDCDDKDTLQVTCKKCRRTLMVKHGSNQRIAMAASILSHIRTHSDIFPFQCDVCDYKCRYETSIKCHVDSHGAAAGFTNYINHPQYNADMEKLKGECFPHWYK